MKYLEAHEIDTNQVFDEDEKAVGCKKAVAIWIYRN